MKKILSILLVSISLIGYSQNRVLIDKLTELRNKENKEYDLMYYESGLFNGIGLSYFENGRLQWEVNYKDGKKDGLHKSWFGNGNGQLRYEKNYKDGKKDGLHKGYYESGQLEWESKYKDGKKVGLHKGWYENGQLYYERNYKDGEKDGLHKKYYESGQLEYEYNYKDGREDGFKEWDSNGVLIEERIN